MTSSLAAEALALVDEVDTITEDIREDVRLGRFDRVDERIAERGRRLGLLRDSLDQLAQPWPRAVSDRLGEIEDQDRALRTWLMEEKKTALRGLDALSGHRIDPYQDRIEGSVALDERR